MNLQEKLDSGVLHDVILHQEGKYFRIEDSDSILYLVRPEFRRTGWREFLMPYEPYKTKIDNKEAIAEVDAFPPLILLGTLGYVLYEMFAALYEWLF